MRNNRIDRIISESIDRVLFESQGEINAYINAIKAGVYDKLLKREGLTWIYRLGNRGDIRQLLHVAEARYNELTGDERTIYHEPRTYVPDSFFDPDMGNH
jgi:hypothetical protein